MAAPDESGGGVSTPPRLPPTAPRRWSRCRPTRVPDGDYVLTLWEGDARVVARYGFRTAKK